MELSPTGRYIPLGEAAEKYGISEDILRERVRSGRIGVGETSKGELLVAEEDVDPSLGIRREDFEHLRGQSIGVSEAGRKYELDAMTVSNWAKAGYIKVLVEPKRRGQKKLLDEADVAYCVAVYRAKAALYDGQMSGVQVFNEDGTPYQPKHPTIAAYKRRRRREKLIDQQQK